MIRYTTRRVVAKTAAYTLVKDQPDASGSLYTNDGATGSVTFTLPSPALAIKGCWYEFLVTVAQSVIVASPSAGQIITNGNIAADNVGFQVASQKVGGQILIYCNGTAWVAIGARPGGGFCVNGTEIAGEDVATQTELGLLVGATAGSITASKVVTRDAGKRIPFETAVPAAAGNAAGNATAISAQVNYVTAADGTTGVILPVGVAGMVIDIINTVSTAAALLKVYPDTGGAINGGSANAAFSVAPGSRGTFTCTAALTWRTTPNSATLAVAGVGAAYKVARGEHTQVAASDTVVTGLTTVISVVVSPRTITVKQLFFQGSPGDQAGSPAAGSILITSKKPTAVNDVTPTAATDFTDNIAVDWIAVGT